MMYPPACGCWSASKYRVPIYQLSKFLLSTLVMPSNGGHCLVHRQSCSLCIDKFLHKLSNFCHHHLVLLNLVFLTKYAKFFETKQNRFCLLMVHRSTSLSLAPSFVQLMAHFWRFLHLIQDANNNMSETIHKWGC